jgi:hypothetical protein
MDSLVVVSKTLETTPKLSGNRKDRDLKYLCLDLNSQLPDAA